MQLAGMTIPPARTALTRREFTAAAIAAGLTAACARTPAPAPAPAPATTAGVPPTTPATGAAQGQGAPNPYTPLADAMMGIVVARYAAQLPEEDRPKVRDAIARGLAFGDRLRKVPITNADDPYSVCADVREEG